MAELAVNRLRPLRRTSPVWAAALAPLFWASAGQAAEQTSTPPAFAPSVLQPPRDASDIAPDAPQLPPVDVLFGTPSRPCHPRGSLQVQVHSGALIPHGAFSRHARVGVAYGAGAAAEWRFSPCSALRLLAAYTRAQFTAKEADLFGPVTVNLITLRADYVLGHRWWRPYVGVGAGVTPWRGDISQPIAQRHNSGRGNPITGTAAIGVDLNLAPHLALAPELAWTPLGGSFKASLWGASLALRGRI
jgi:hypothetical protein